jgi:hypothetical protein
MGKRKGESLQKIPSNPYKIVSALHSICGNDVQKIGCVAR